jgi:hypothetical protein
MKISHGFRHLTTAWIASLALAATAPAQQAGDAGSAPLKWTPHRAATSSAPAAASAEPMRIAEQPTAERVVTVRPSAPPATVYLPAQVPAAPGRDYAAAPRTLPPRQALPRRQAVARPTAPPAEETVFGLDVIRAPRGEVGRPILADERPRPRSRPVDPRLGGGLAPRFNPQSNFQQRSRPERLAMNVDGVPSVMARASQGDAVETAPTESIPTPPPADSLPGGDAIGLPDQPTIIETMPGDGMPADGMPSAGMPIEMGGYDPGMAMSMDDGMMLGEYPSQMHVESFYDDPYACEDDTPLAHHTGRICMWLRRFGKPYYGWRWYRDFTASVGVTGFTNPADLGLGGNFGINEYLNFAMPLWNAFGLGWQVGARGVHTNFETASVQTAAGSLDRGGHDQVFVTTGLFTRAFEGRGLQGGVAWDYLNDNYFDNVDMAQLRGELSYVWGFHEFGFWGAFAVNDAQIFLLRKKVPTTTASVLDMYCGFYRLQFGDANELKIWGGGSHEGDGIVGSMLRAPLTRSWALESTFTYVIPDALRTVDIDGAGTLSTYQDAAWNVSCNLVFYPAGRSRRSLASPYRPLFDVADNGSMIRNW